MTRISKTFLAMGVVAAWVALWAPSPGASNQNFVITNDNLIQGNNTGTVWQLENPASPELVSKATLMTGGLNNYIGGAGMTAFASFLRAKKLAAPLQAHDWAGFARGYNGSNYAINQYDVKLADKFQKLSSGAMPDFSLRAAQLYLTFCGFNPGGVDGIMGKDTRSAIMNFQTKKGQNPTGVVDDALLASLEKAALG